MKRVITNLHGNVNIYARGKKDDTGVYSEYYIQSLNEDASIDDTINFRTNLRNISDSIEYTDRILLYILQGRISDFQRGPDKSPTGDQLASLYKQAIQLIEEKEKEEKEKK